MFKNHIDKMKKEFKDELKKEWIKSTLISTAIIACTCVVAISYSTKK